MMETRGEVPDSPPTPQSHELYSEEDVTKIAALQGMDIMWNNSGDLAADFYLSTLLVCLKCDNYAASTAPYRSERVFLGWSSTVQLQSAQDIECVCRAAILRPSRCLGVGERRDCD